ncbi:HAD family hydrolase [Lysinibacillus sp. LZ02]|uniref:HAD family hydrolase n=1 Tax=Lysinibacillus sp. LZ02 TaxID=3420668 RepID=UPI003D36C450
MMKAIIFDFDGTIIDTETAWYTVFKDAYEQYGVELSLDTYSQCLGTSLHSFNPYTYLSTHHNISMDLDAFRKIIHQNHTELMKKESMRPGILTLLQEAKAAGLKIGLASSSHRAWIDQFVNLLEIGEYFDCYCTADTVKHVKPDPELYLQALEQLGVQANEAIAIEDSPNGARAAVAAGLHTLVIKNTITKQLPFGQGHHTIESLAHYELQQLADCFTQKTI